MPTYPQSSRLDHQRTGGPRRRNTIKQHLRIKRFFGTSENAVKTQIWIAVSVYVLVAIVKKRLAIDASLDTLLQIFSLTLFEKMPLQQAFSANHPSSDDVAIGNQLNLFSF